MKIIAHRGSSLIWPENTVLAFDNAHKAGATGFETDLRLSKDQQIILSHDANLTQFGYPDKTINELTADEICNIKISSRDNKCSDSIITLKTLLQKYPDKDYIFDCKISDKQLFDILKNQLSELNFHNRIWFLTWSKEADAYIQHIFPGYKYFPRELHTKLWAWSSLLRLGKMFEPENHILSLPAYHLYMPIFTKRQIADIHRRGKKFVGYLVNTEKDFKYCISCGIKTVLTDRPNLISKLLEQ